jgi:predicted amino acid racemase
MPADNGNGVGITKVSLWMSLAMFIAGALFSAGVSFGRAATISDVNAAKADTEAKIAVLRTEHREDIQEVSRKLDAILKLVAEHK